MSNTEVLIEKVFEFDAKKAFEEWDKSNAFITQDISRCEIEFEGKTLEIPEPPNMVLQARGQEQVQEKSLQELKEEEQQYLKEIKEKNPAFGTFLDTYPQMIRFFSQVTGLLFLVDAYGIKSLTQPPLMANTVEKEERSKFSIHLNSDGTSLEVTALNPNPNVSYRTPNNPQGVDCILKANRSVVMFPIDRATQKFSGTARITGTLLFAPPQDNISDFNGYMDQLRQAKTNPMLEVSLGAADLKEVTALPPSLISLVATPVVSSGAFAGAALVATLVFSVVPPVGLSILAASLIVAGIGALIGLGVNAYRTHQYKKHEEDKKRQFAQAFSAQLKSPDKAQRIEASSPLAIA